MVKAKFGDAVRSKNPTAQVNEALCKILAHNLCVVIQSMFELGIEPAFSAGREKKQKTTQNSFPVTIDSAGYLL